MNRVEKESRGWESQEEAEEEKHRKLSGLDKFNDILSHELPKSGSSSGKSEIEEDDLKKPKVVADIFATAQRSSRKSQLTPPSTKTR